MWELLTYLTFDQSYETAYANIWPLWLKAQHDMGCSIASEFFSFVRASLSQKLNLPSEPTVASVPWTGWNFISFTCWKKKRLKNNFYICSVRYFICLSMVVIVGSSHTSITICSQRNLRPKRSLLKYTGYSFSSHTYFILWGLNSLSTGTQFGSVNILIQYCNFYYS